MSVQDLLTKYNDTVKYGPIFPCCSCQALQFKKDVSSASDVTGLRTEEERSRYLDVNLINTNSNLFTTLDRSWICRDCCRFVQEGKIPPCSAKNNMRATWRTLPTMLLDLTSQELDTLANTQIFCVVHKLSTGAAEVDQYKKTLFLPLSLPIHDEGIIDNAANKVFKVKGLHLWPPGQERNVRPRQMSHALNHLLMHSEDGLSGKRGQLKLLFEDKNLPADGETNDDKRRLRPKHEDNDQVHVTILPVLSDLQTNARQIMHCGPLDTRTRDLFDPIAESGMDLERGQPITKRQWMVQRLRSMFKGGPSDDIELVFSTFLKLELSWLNQVQAMQDMLKGQLIKHKGTKEYFTKACDDIRAIERCYGPANFSFSLTMNTDSDHFLASFISQNRESEELKGLQVWESQDEVELLTLRPGKVKGQVDCGYYVHQKTDVSDDTCIFHPNCKRTPLQDWSRW